jgi:hypothetical protein
MRKMMLLQICILVLLLLAFGSFAQERPLLRDEEAQAAWREDLQVMAEQMEARHPNLFWRVSEEDFRQAVNDLDAEIPYLTDNQIIIGLTRIVALIDGHTHLGLLQPEVGFGVYPLRLYWFNDGLFVVDAEDESIIGARLIEINGYEVEEINGRITPLVQHDNEMSILNLSPIFFTIPEVLQGLGIIEDVNQPNYLLERADGDRFTLNPTPVETNGQPFQEWFMVGLPQQSRPLYLQHRSDENFWYTFLPETRTLYIQYNRVQRQTASGLTLLEFSREIETFIEENEVERVVLDLRHNPGGDNTTYGSFLSRLSDNTLINQPGKLFTIIGRQTFSAATNFATDLERRTETLFIGEPTGGSPNLYGDTVPIRLPNSQIVVQVSGRYWQKSDPNDTRPAIEPDIPVALSSEDFFSGRDPALEAILSYEG